MHAIQKGMHDGGHIKLHKFSRAQRRHNVKQGAGWLSDLKDLAVGAAKKHLPGLIDKGKKLLIDQGKKLIGKHAPGLIDKAVGHVQKHLGSHGHHATKVGDLIKGQVAKHTGHGIRGCGMKGCKGAKCGRGVYWPARQGGRTSTEVTNYDMRKRRRGGKLYTVAGPTEYDRFDPVNMRRWGKGRKATIATGKSILNESGW